MTHARIGIFASLSLGLAALLAFTSSSFAAGAPTTPPAPPTTPSLGVTAVAGGWIRYVDATTIQLAADGSPPQTVSGTVGSNGACTITGTASLAPNASAQYVIETAFNPSTCQAQFVTGNVTPATAALLAGPSSTLAAAAASGSSQSTATSTQTVTGSATRPPTLADPPGAGADPSATGHTKVAWIDPLDITINSVAANLTWNYNGSYVSSASAKADSYEFPYDGWSNTGLPAISFEWLSDGSVRYYEPETFVNTDFEDIVLALLGLAGWAACGFSTAPAVFYLDPGVRGYGNGNLGGSWSWSATGGCSDLVHSSVNFGYGSTS